MQVCHYLLGVCWPLSALHLSMRGCLPNNFSVVASTCSGLNQDLLFGTSTVLYLPIGCLLFME